jgi:hypothetical protein
VLQVTLTNSQLRAKAISDTKAVSDLRRKCDANRATLASLDTSITNLCDELGEGEHAGLRGRPARRATSTHTSHIFSCFLCSRGRA